VRAGIVDYVRDRKLEKPVVVGHSLGGFMVYLLGSSEPDLVGPLIAADGLPSSAN
jgi:pimeloyl-ACP methyl ester carboxylesterase